VEVASNTAQLDVNRDLIPCDHDRSGQHRSPSRKVERRLLQAMLAAAAFFVSSATSYAAQAPAQTLSGQAPAQYQAKSRDITAGSTRGVPSESSVTAAWLSQPSFLQNAPLAVWSHPSQSAPGQRLRAWYQAVYSRYRLLVPITASDPSAPRTLTRTIAANLSPILSSKLADIQSVIGTSMSLQTFRSTVIPARERPVEPQAQAVERRRLLELGLALGLAYVTFLVGWFWKTRGRRHSVGRVVRF